MNIPPTPQKKAWLIFVLSVFILRLGLFFRQPKKAWFYPVNDSIIWKFIKLVCLIVNDFSHLGNLGALRWTVKMNISVLNLYFLEEIDPDLFFLDSDSILGCGAGYKSRLLVQCLLGTCENLKNITGNSWIPTRGNETCLVQKLTVLYSIKAYLFSKAHRGVSR